VRRARISFFTAREDVGGSGDGALLRTSPEDFAAAAAGEANAILPRPAGGGAGRRAGLRGAGPHRRTAL
jgi:hypothetical protein